MAAMRRRAHKRSKEEGGAPSSFLSSMSNFGTYFCPKAAKKAYFRGMYHAWPAITVLYGPFF